jgi:phage terminase large subunit-like protein
MFKKTAKQVQALDVLNSHRHGLLFGGSRSGKTFIAVRNVFLRALKKTSKHLIVRFRYNHARVSLAHETVPAVLERCFPGVSIQENKADGYWTVPSQDGGESEVWLGGTDDADRIEKLLGSEYSTIYANECSQVPWDAILLLWTRLAESSGLPLRFYYDCNPPGKKHWTYSMFFQGKLPDDSIHSLDVGSIRVNPTDNLDNLPAEYLQTLEMLPRRQRKRFLKGLYLDDVEGALWTDRMINAARLLKSSRLRKTVVAVDPSVSNNPKSDECGIVLASLDEDRQGLIRGDFSAKLGTRRWAQRVVNVYETFEANEIVAEVNQGGDLVEDAIHNINPHIKVVKVHAATGKIARAEPVSMLYEQNRVAHAKAMPELESELTETVLDEVKKSPNRLDALVWALTHLLVKKTSTRIHVG